MIPHETPDIIWSPQADNHGSVSTQLRQAEAQKQTLLDAVENPKLQKLAHQELTECEALCASYEADADAIKKLDKGMLSDLRATKTLEVQFGELPWFDGFLRLIESELSASDTEQLIDKVSSPLFVHQILEEFGTEGLPANSAAFSEFIADLGILQKWELQFEQDNAALNDYLESIPTLRNIDGVPEVEPLLEMLQELENSGDASAKQMHKIVYYLVGADGKSGQLDTILEALARKDAENLANGKRTGHLQSFARTARAFSPDIASRIDTFLAQEEVDHSASELHWVTERAKVFANFPSDADIRADKTGNYTSHLDDGTMVHLEKRGGSSRRSLSIDGAGISISASVVDLE